MRVRSPANPPLRRAAAVETPATPPDASKPGTLAALAVYLERRALVMLALGFLLIIGMTLIADGTGFHIPKGYIYAAMAFSALVEGLNMLARKKKAPASGGS